MTKKLQILQQSLAKKEALLERRLEAHYADVKRANGQPLNDKRNGQATLNRWERQKNTLRNTEESIARTKDAIAFEEGRIIDVDRAKTTLPPVILKLIEDGTLIQWRKYPRIFFVEGVDKARIIWDAKKQVVAYKFLNRVTDQNQRSKFAQIYNSIYSELN